MASSTSIETCNRLHLERHTMDMETLRAHLLARMESDFPDEVLAALQAMHGKPITTRMIGKLPDVPGGWKLRRQYGMTHLDSGPYTDGLMSHPQSIHLLLCHTEASVALDISKIEGLNTSYFKGRRERNAQRQLVLGDEHTLTEAARAMEEVSQAIAALQQTIDYLETFTGWGNALHPEDYSIEQLCGLRNKRGDYLLNRDFNRNRS
jgi:hypothetical protein